MLKLDQRDGVLLFISSNYVSSSFCYFGFCPEWRLKSRKTKGISLSTSS